MSPALATDSDDPLLDARIDLQELSLVYAHQNPKVIAARERLEELTKTYADETLIEYQAHVRERIQEAEAEAGELIHIYLPSSPRMRAVQAKLDFLRSELQRRSVF